MIDPADKTPGVSNYQGNSNKQKAKAAKEGAEGEKRVKKVVTTEVIQRKSPFFKRVTKSFVGDDANSVAQYVLADIILPRVQELIVDAISQGTSRLILGDGSSSRIRARGSNGHVSYNKAFGGKAKESRRASVDADDTDDFVLATRVLAEEVLEALGDIIDQYDVATVSDLKELVGVTGNFTDDKWGWSDLRGAHVRKVRDGYLLDLPKVKPID